MGTRYVWGGGLMLLLGTLLSAGGGCIGAEDNGGDQCALFGGTCVASVSYCQGALPYDGCGSGVCCEFALPMTPDATVRAPDATTASNDATIVFSPDATLGSDSATKETGTSNDVTTASMDTGIPSGDAGLDSSAPLDATSDDSSSADAATDAPSADAHVADAHEADAHHVDAHEADAHVVDAHTEDAKSTSKDGGRNFEAGFTCNNYASPNEPASKCNVTMCPADPFCQKNGCFDGDYCHLTTARCVMPSGVTCDGGV